MTKLEMTDAMKKVIKARASLMQENLGIASMLIELDLVEVSTEKCPTMATDGKRIFFSEWVLTIPIGELKTVLFHEGCHVIWEHPIRRQERDPYWFNICCDIVINNWIKYDLRMTLPSDGVWDWKHRNKTPEDVYRTIMSDQDEKQSLLDELLDLTGGANGSDESDADDGSGAKVTALMTENLILVKYFQMLLAHLLVTKDLSYQERFGICKMTMERRRAKMRQRNLLKLFALLHP